MLVVYIYIYIHNLHGSHLTYWNADFKHLDVIHSVVRIFVLNGQHDT